MDFLIQVFWIMYGLFWSQKLEVVEKNFVLALLVVTH